MRKFTLLLVLVAFGFASFAQYTFDCGNQPFKQEKSIKQIKKTSRAAAYGETYWAQTFDKNEFDWEATLTDDGLLDPTTLPDSIKSVDNKNKGAFWHWSTSSARGYDWMDPVTWDSFKSEDKHNGSFLFEATYLRKKADGSFDDYDHDAYLEMGPINLEKASNVVLTFDQAFAYCCSSAGKLTVEVSADHDPANPTAGNWTSYEVNKKTPLGYLNSASEAQIEQYIGHLVDGKKNVYLRFRIKDISSWFWYIDNIQLRKAPAADMRLDTYWYDYSTSFYQGFNGKAPNEEYFFGGYSEFALPAMDSFPVIRATAHNWGSSSKDVSLVTDFYLDSVLVFTNEGEAKNIKPGAHDTVFSFVNYRPTELGNYYVETYLKYTGDSEDYTPENNKHVYRFTTSSHVMARAYKSRTANYGKASLDTWSVGGVNFSDNGNGLGVPYEVLPFEDETIKAYGLEFYLYPLDPAEDDTDSEKAAYQAIIDEDITVTAKLFTTTYTNVAGDDDEILVQSAPYVLSESDFGTFVRLPFVTNLDLKAERYYAVISFEGINQNKSCYIGFDRGAPRQPWSFINGIHQPNKPEGQFTNYFGTGALAINLLLGDVNNVEDYKTGAINNIDMYPNPANKELVITNTWNAAKIQIANIIGQNVITLEETFGASTTINISDLESGIYMVSVVDANNNVTTKKIIKK